jgi:hypothetical protein
MNTNREEYLESLEAPHPAGSRPLYAPKKRRVPFKDTSENERRPWLALGLAVAVFCFVYVAVIALGGALLLGGGQSALAALREAEVDASNREFGRAINHLGEVERDFRRAKTGLRFLAVARPVPYVGAQVRGADAIVEASSEAVKAVEEVLHIGNRIEAVLERADDAGSLPKDGIDELSFYELPQELRQEMLLEVSRVSSELEVIQVRMQRADEKLKELYEIGVSPALLRVADPLSELTPVVEESIAFLTPMTQILEELVGIGGARQWLVLYMNNNELRPGGGFIGVYGLLQMEDGEILDFSVDDSYAADAFVVGVDSYNPQAPAPLARYLGVDKWYFRDANWSPDFTESANTATQLLRQQYSVGGQPVPEVRGVIGLTPTVAKRLLEYLGPITVDGLTFTSENVDQLLQFEVQFNYENRGLTVDERKQIVSRLTEVVINRLTDLPIAEYPNLFRIALNSFEDKQLAMYAYDESAQGAISGAGWSGEIDYSSGEDAIIIADANLAALKTDPVVDREITYSIEEVDGEYLATLNMRYIHRGSFTNTVTRYRTYTRFFVPLGSEFISGDGALAGDILENPSGSAGMFDVVNEGDYTTFGAFTSVEPGRIRDLTVTYKLAPDIAQNIDDGLYRLNFFKQMGAAHHALTLDLDFGKELRTAIPAELRRNFGNTAYEYEGALDADKEFIVRFN